MKILALEFSTLRRSAAVLELSQDSASILASQQEIPPPKQRAGSPFDLLQSLFSPSLTIDSIEAVVVGLGPGSYTGIRSALAIAHGLNLARGILAVGISSTDAIAYSAWQTGARGALEVVIDAQRGEIYSATYELNQSSFHETEPLKILSAPAGRSTIAGPDLKNSATGARQDSDNISSRPGGAAESSREVKRVFERNPRSSLSESPRPEGSLDHTLEIFPTAEALGRLAAMRNLLFVSPEKMEPIYLREPSFTKAPAIRHA